MVQCCVLAGGVEQGDALADGIVRNQRIRGCVWCSAVAHACLSTEIKSRKQEVGMGFVPVGFCAVLTVVFMCKVSV